MSSTLIQPRVMNFIDGQFQGSGQDELEVISPLDGGVISSVPLSSTEDVSRAVMAAQNAFYQWSALTLKERVQVFFQYRALLEKHMEELSALVHLENGKTMTESKAEVLKSIELCEFAVSMPLSGVRMPKGVSCLIFYYNFVFAG